MKKDENIEGLVEKYASQMKTMMGTVIGKSYADLDGVGVHVRTRETNLGDLVSDIMRETAQADAAIMNGGGIRTSIKKGDITVNDIYTVLPFDNYIVAIELTGETDQGGSGVWRFSRRGRGRPFSPDFRYCLHLLAFEKERFTHRHRYRQRQTP